MSTTDRAPAFQFYAKDWLADPKVASMSFDHQGRYIHLLASMWEFGDAGCQIPRKMAENLVGKRFVDSIISDEVIDVYENGGPMMMFSNRLFEEAQKLRSRSEAARRSANLRWEKKKDTDANA